MKNQVVSYDRWLCLAAAPTFAIMALLTSVLGSGQPDMLCSAAYGASSLSGMVPMYLLMSAFHVPPWLRLISGRRSGAFRSRARPYAPSCRKTVVRDPAAALADSFSPRQTS
jgi:hypothetical protein